MKKIVLLCAAGMSTSLLVSKMQAAADKSGFACEIRAYGVAQAVVDGIARLSALVAMHFPAAGGGSGDELPDRPVLL